MDSRKADALIRKLWAIGESLKAFQGELDDIENAIADEAEDE